MRKRRQSPAAPQVRANRFGFLARFALSWARGHRSIRLEAHMKIGMLAFVASYTIDPATVARKLEAAGFESIWLPEHPVIPIQYKTPFPRGDGKIPKAYYHMIDPFVGLALAAAASKTIKLGTGICLVPERDPIVTAREVATP